MTFSPKRVFRGVYWAAMERIRDLRIEALVRELGAAEPSPEILLPIVAQLREAWGNTGWTADIGFLDELVRRSLASTGPFLDCGSGLSTVILGVLAKKVESEVWSLEQDEHWALLMEARLRMLGLANVHLLHAPLEITDGAAWYALKGGSLPAAFSLVFCDGPAVRRSEWPEDVFQAWRVGVVAGLRRRGVTFETIVLDDAEDRRCPGVLDAWQRAGLEVTTVTTEFGRHVVARSRASDRQVECSG